MRRGTVWLIGVLGVVALWGAAVAMKARPIERHVAVTTLTELKRRGLDRRFEQLSIQIDGRALTLTGTALSDADRAGALAVAASTPGVSRVVDQIKVAPEAKPFVFRAIRNANGTATLAGVSPASEITDRLAEAARAVFGGEVQVSVRLARGAPEGDWFAAAKLAVELIALIEHGEVSLSDKRITVLGRAADDAALDVVATALGRALPAGYEGQSDLYTPLDEDLRAGPLASVKECQALLDKVLAGKTFRFRPGRADIVDPPARLFDRMAAAMQRCRSLYLQVLATADVPGGDASASFRLSEARARALVEELAKRGVAKERMTPLGRGERDGRLGATEPALEFRISDAAVPVVRPYVWQIERRANGSGLITGHHPSREAESILAGLARPALRGPLTDDSRLAHGTPAGDWLAAARLAIEAIGVMERGTAELRDFELTIAGIAKDDAVARAIATALTERMPNGFSVKFALTTVLDEELKGPEITAAERCQVLVETVAKTARPDFDFDGQSLHDSQRPFFTRLAAATRRCDRFVLEIGAHGTGAGDPEASRALSERWAQAVADALARAGAERRRLRAVGLGNTQPLGETETDDGRLRNRRIVFRIVP